VKSNKLKQSRIPIIIIRWESKHEPEFTWEREDQMKLKYPHFFYLTCCNFRDENSLTGGYCNNSIFPTFVNIIYQWIMLVLYLSYACINSVQQLCNREMYKHNQNNKLTSYSSIKTNIHVKHNIITRS
jgi:hypothetical protein